MNIIYTVHQFYPECWAGTEKFVFKMSSMMQKAGHRVSVITYSFYKNSFFDKSIDDILYKEFTFEGIRIIALRHRFPPKQLDINLGDDSMTKMAKYLLSTEKPDILHIGHPMRVNELATATKSFNIPYVITLTDFWMLCPKVILVDSENNLCSGPCEGKICAQDCPEIPSNFITRRLIMSGNLLLGAKKVISPSNFLGNIFKKEFRGLDNMGILNHGIDYNIIGNNKKRYKKEDTLVFCYIGSLAHHKGVHLLLQAFKEIKSKNIVLKVFGRGTDSGYVNKLFNMGKSDPRIEFCGFFHENEFGNILSSVDVVIVPSLWYENYPIIIYEALASHTPVISSGIGGMTEIVQDGINGFTFQRGNKESLRNILEKIANNATLLNDIKKNIKYVSIPSIEQEAYAYHKLYVDILKG